MAVVPPSTGAFSNTSTRAPPALSGAGPPAAAVSGRPPAAAARAADRPAAPDPTTTTSASRSQSCRAPVMPGPGLLGDGAGVVLKLFAARVVAGGRIRVVVEKDEPRTAAGESG